MKSSKGRADVAAAGLAAAAEAVEPDCCAVLAALPLVLAVLLAGALLSLSHCSCLSAKTGVQQQVHGAVSKLECTSTDRAPFVNGAHATRHSNCHTFAVQGQSV